MGVFTYGTLGGARPGPESIQHPLFKPLQQLYRPLELECMHILCKYLVATLVQALGNDTSSQLRS